MEEEATNAVIDKFAKLIAANGGTITKEDRWGKRRLAYEIKKRGRGLLRAVLRDVRARVRRRS